MATLLTKLIVRNDTTANWNNVKNTMTLSKGEIGIEWCTVDSVTFPRIKIGDGTTVWGSLPYFNECDVTITGDGNTIVSATYNANNGKLTLTKGNRLTGSGLTANTILLGNGGVDVKTSSKTITTTLGTDDTTVPTSKAVKDVVNGMLNGSTEFNLLKATSATIGDLTVTGAATFNNTIIGNISGSAGSAGKVGHVLKLKNTSGTTVSYDGSAEVDLSATLYATDSDKLDGYHGDVSARANTYALRNPSGQAYFETINVTHAVEDNYDLNSFFYDKGDGWLRRMSLSAVKEKLGLASAFTFKGSVTNYSDLAIKAPNPSVGDVWNIEKEDKEHKIDAGDNVAWYVDEQGVGHWDNLSGYVNMSNVAFKDANNTFTGHNVLNSAEIGNLVVTGGASGNFTGTFNGTLNGNATTATTADKTKAAVTFNNSGSGAASGTTFDGSTARTISYNTIGAVKAITSVDNNIPRFDGTGGQLQGSKWYIDDSGFLQFKGQANTYTVFRPVDSNDVNGNGILIGSGGLTVIGGGEAAGLYSGVAGGTERMIVANDNSVEIVTNLQNSLSDGKTFTFNTSGQLELPTANGTAPLKTSSTTKVDNLNADLLDGKHASDFATSDHTHTSFDTLAVGNLNVTGSASFTNTINGNAATATNADKLDGQHGEYYLDTFNHKPHFSKTYSNASYYATTSTWDASTWYFARIVPTERYKPWRIKYRLTTICEKNQSYRSETWATVTGCGTTSESANACLTYANFNNYLTSCHYYTALRALTVAGYNAGLGHALGVSILYSSSYTDSQYPRTFKIEVFDYENCTVIMEDGTLPKWGEGNLTSTNYGNLYDMNAISRGLQETGDSDSGNYNVRYYYSRFIAGNILNRYQIMVTDGKYIYGICNTDNRYQQDKTSFYTGEFDPTGPILYHDYGGTRAAGGYYDGAMYQQILADMRYSFNHWNSTASSADFTSGDAIYLVTVPQANGKVKLYFGSSGTDYKAMLTKTLPTTEDGLVYIYLGQTYDCYRMMLILEHPAFIYKHGAVRPYLGDDYIYNNGNATLSSLTSSTATIGNLTVNGSANFNAGLTGNVTGNASTATTLANTRKIWGQNFNGSADVTGDLLLGSGKLFFNSAASGVNLSVAGSRLQLINGGSAYGMVMGDLAVGGTYSPAISKVPSQGIYATGNIKTGGQLISEVAQGTAPIAVTSTTVVSNLNADMVDGKHASDFIAASDATVTATANKILKRNGDGDADVVAVNLCTVNTSTAKATMVYDATDDCIAFIFV